MKVLFGLVPHSSVSIPGIPAYRYTGISESKIVFKYKISENDTIHCISLIMDEVLANSLVLSVIFCSILLGFTATLLVLHACDCRVFDSKGKYVPGPISHLWGKSVILVLYKALITRQLSTVLRDVILNELGDGDIAAFKTVFGRQIVVIGHPDLAKYVLSGHYLKFVKSERVNRLQIFMGSGLFTSNGNVWQIHRSLCSPGFQTEALRSMIPIFHKESQNLVKYWLSNINKLAKVQGGARSIPVNLKNDLHTLTMSVMCRSGFGYVFQTNSVDRTEISAAFNNVMEEVNSRVSSPTGPVWLVLQRVLPESAGCAALRRLRTLIDKAITDRLIEYSVARSLRIHSRNQIRTSGAPAGWSESNFSSSNAGPEGESFAVPFKSTENLGVVRDRDRDILDLLLECGGYVSPVNASSANSKPQQQVDSGSISSPTTTKNRSENAFNHKELVDHICTFVFIGHETTSACLLWTIYELCRHPDAQELCQKEVDSIMHGDGSLQGTGTLDYEAINKFNFLVQVLKESMRLHPVVGALSRTCATDDCSVGEFSFCPGTTVVVSTNALHKHAAFWADPLEFRPERFALDNIRETMQHPFQYVPFSAGPRSCIGQRFALMEILVVLGTLLSQFSFSLAAKDAGTKVIVEEDGLTSQPKDLSVLVTARIPSL
jgi:cytochrome P450